MNETPLIRFDWAIKYILRDKANFDVLEGFLTAVLKRDIRILEILESESNQNDENDKFNRVDLLAENQHGEKIIIEVQNNREVHYLERMLYGTSKLIVENINLGDTYKEIKKVISISILYFSLTKAEDEYVYYGTTEFRGIHSHKPLKLPQKQQKKLTYIKASTLFPEYYLIEVEKFQDIIATDLDEWIYMLKHEAIRDDFKSKYINKAKQKLDYLKLPLEKKRRYQRFLENLGREKDMLESSKEDGIAIGEERGRKIGKEEGIAIGRKEGVAIGRKEGLREGVLLSAKNMKKAGVELSVIANITGLSEAEIAEL